MSESCDVAQAHIGAVESQVPSVDIADKVVDLASSLFRPQRWQADRNAVARLGSRPDEAHGAERVEQGRTGLDPDLRRRARWAFADGPRKPVDDALDGHVSAEYLRDDVGDDLSAFDAILFELRGVALRVLPRLDLGPAQRSEQRPRRSLVQIVKVCGTECVSRPLSTASKNGSTPSFQPSSLEPTYDRARAVSRNSWVQRP